MNLVARCGIYETRPDVCRTYPKADSYVPPNCTYIFTGEKREGECACDKGSCCSLPRQGGEPGGAPLPEVAGGEPCKHLVWEESSVKTASRLPIVAVGDDLRGMEGLFDEAIVGSNS
jgi:hypothetical protein